VFSTVGSPVGLDGAILKSSGPVILNGQSVLKNKTPGNNVSTLWSGRNYKSPTITDDNRTQKRVAIHNWFKSPKLIRRPSPKKNPRQEERRRKNQREEKVQPIPYYYEIWMGEVRGGKMKKYKEPKEETCIYWFEVCLSYPYIYGRADGLNTKNPTTYLLLRESFCGQCRSPNRTLFRLIPRFPLLTFPATSANPSTSNKPGILAPPLRLIMTDKGTSN